MSTSGMAPAKREKGGGGWECRKKGGNAQEFRYAQKWSKGKTEGRLTNALGEERSGPWPAGRGKKLKGPSYRRSKN